jgi:hypothetical protein
MSSSNSTLLSGYNFDLLGNSTQLTGSHFKDPVLVAAIVVNGICALFFALLCVATWMMKDKAKKGRRVFAVIYGLLGTMFVFVSPFINLFKDLEDSSMKNWHLHLPRAFLRTTGDGIAHEYEPTVPRAYLALPVIKQLLANGTDTTLLFVIYRVIKNRFRAIKRDKDAYNSTQRIHVGLAVLVFLLGLADSILYVYSQIYTATHDAGNAGATNIFNWYKDVNLSYTSAYCVVSLEMFACAIWIFNKSRQTSKPNLVS